MIEIAPSVIFFFVMVVAAVLTAIASRDDILQQLAAILFVGWGVYSPADAILGPEAGQIVWFNMALDSVLVTFAGILTIRHDSRPGRYVCALFGAMFVWHVWELFGPTGWYYRVLNGLFAAQLLVVIAASVERLYAADVRPDNRPPPESGNDNQALVLQWPNRDLGNPMPFPLALRSESKASTGMSPLSRRETTSTKKNTQSSKSASVL